MGRTTTQPGDGENGSERPLGLPWGQLWQVPLFVLGLVCFVGVVATRPLWMSPRVLDAARPLRELRQALSARDWDPPAVQSLASAALQAAEEDPILGAEAHFLAGSAHVALAQRGGEEARDHWRQARTLLEQAQTLVVSDEDAPRLAYRLAKAWAYTDYPDLARLTQALARSLESGADGPEDAARGYGLLAEAYLKRPEPDLEQALQATERQLQQPIVNDGILVPARLTRAELLLRLRRGEEARQVLRHLNAPSAPALVVRARELLARSLEMDEMWADASAAWAELANDRATPRQDRHRLLYQLGWCHRNAGQFSEARAAWEECLRLNMPSDETPAAALGVGELRLAGERPAEALEAFARAIRDVSSPQEWRNSRVSLEQARSAFEAGCKSLRERSFHELSLQLAQMYERLALSPRALELQGLASEGWARASREQARQTRPVEAAQALLRTADSLFTQAGQAWARAAVAISAPIDQGERFWRAAALHAEGRDFGSAAAVLERFLALAQQPELSAPDRLGPRLEEAWFRLGEARRALGRESDALEAYLESLKWADGRLFPGAGRYAARARYHLALTWKARGKLDDAQEILEQNAQILREAGAGRDPEIKEKTLFALGDLYFERRQLKGELSRAVATLENALEQFPASSDALVGRYELAESYRLLADELSRSLGPHERLTVEARLRLEQQVAGLREKSMAQYRQLGEVLRNRPKRDSTEDGLLVYAEFSTAESRFLLGDYEGSAREFEALAEKYRGRVDGFKALAGVVRAAKAQASVLAATPGNVEGRAEQANRRASRALLEIKAGMPGLDEATRGVFETWLAAIEGPAMP